MAYDNAVRQEIARYLEKVDGHLRSLSPDERRDILDNIESHIHEALAGRGGERATVEDLRALLGEMDPPESYAPAAGDAEADRAPPAAAPTRPRLEHWAVALFVGGIVGPVLLGLGGTLFAKDPVIEGNFVTFSICLGVAVELLGLLLGIFSWRRKAGKVVVIGVPTLALLGLGLVLLITHYRSRDMASTRAELEEAVRQSIDHKKWVDQFYKDYEETRKRLWTQPSDAKPPG